MTASVTAAGRVSCLALGEAVWFCVLVFMYTILKNFNEKPNNSLLLEKIAELTMHLESLLTEVEVFGKQRGLGREAYPRCLKTSRGCGFCSPGALGQPPVLVVCLGRGE